MNGEPTTYEIQFCGDEWDTAGMRGGVAVPVPAASEVRLWDAAYWRDDDPSQGTYVVGDEPIAVAVWQDSGYDNSAATDGGYTADGGETEWYGWQGAIKHATASHPDKDAIWAFIDANF